MTYEGEMAVHLHGDGEEGKLRCSERVGVLRAGTRVR